MSPRPGATSSLSSLYSCAAIFLQLLSHSRAPTKEAPAACHLHAISPRPSARDVPVNTSTSRYAPDIDVHNATLPNKNPRRQAARARALAHPLCRLTTPRTLLAQPSSNPLPASTTITPPSRRRARNSHHASRAQRVLSTDESRPSSIRAREGPTSHNRRRAEDQNNQERSHSRPERETCRRRWCCGVRTQDWAHWPAEVGGELGGVQSFLLVFEVAGNGGGGGGGGATAADAV